MSEDAAHYGAMDERRAREILGINPSDKRLVLDGLYLSGGYVSIVNGRALPDGTFTADELEAIAWWMRNKA